MLVGGFFHGITCCFEESPPFCMSYIESRSAFEAFVIVLGYVLRYE